jgi:ABC-type multidrug transport system ATPase subunit
MLRFEGRGLAKRYGSRPALDGVDVAVAPGEVLMVVGPSGAGKTTLLRIAALLLAPDRGEVRLDGEPPSKQDDVRLRRRIGWVGQKPVVFRQSAFENVVLGLHGRDIAGDELVRFGRDAMERLDVWKLRDEPARRLSGGEQQRIAFARVAVRKPDFWVLDEFAANLDPANVAVLEAEVRSRASAGAAVLASTHDLAQAARLADRVAFLLEGRIVEQGEAKQVLGEPRTPEARAFLRTR